MEEKGIAMLLTTPETIRTLQRKLYTKAKQGTAYCHVLDVEYADATTSVATENIGRRNVHALA